MSTNCFVGYSFKSRPMLGDTDGIYRFARRRYRRYRRPRQPHAGPRRARVGPRRLWRPREGSWVVAGGRGQLRAAAGSTLRAAVAAACGPVQGRGGRVLPCAGSRQPREASCGVAGDFARGRGGRWQPHAGRQPCTRLRWLCQPRVALCGAAPASRLGLWLRAEDGAQ